MKAEDWMTTEVHVCRPETDLNDAARSMWENECGCLPVVDEHGRVVGMLTDRDLCMGVYTQGKSPRELSVQNSMSKSVFSCRPADTIEHVLRLIAEHQVRRLPVVDEDGKLRGLLAVNDLVRRVVALQDARLKAGLDARLVEALASVCQPRRVSTQPEPDSLSPKSGSSPTSGQENARGWSVAAPR